MIILLNELSIWAEINKNKPQIGRESTGNGRALLMKTVLSVHLQNLNRGYSAEKEHHFSVPRSTWSHEILCEMCCPTCNCYCCSDELLPNELENVTFCDRRLSYNKNGVKLPFVILAYENHQVFALFLS